jgi:hypothetical protein
MGTTSFSTTLGGIVNIDGTEVWWIPFDARTGNVPALGTVGAQNCTGGTSGATGEFLGIWASIPGAPVAAAAAIPASGFIKFRSKVGDFVDNDVIALPGGATVTVNSTTGGQRGWIHVVGEVTNNVSVPRLGAYNIIGSPDMFELGVTDGTDDQTFNIPVLDSVGAIWVETGAGTGVFEKWLNGGGRWGTATAFISTDERGKFFGQWKSVAANTTNGSPTVTMTDTTGFTVGMPIQNIAGTTPVALPDGVTINAINPGVNVTISSNATSTAAITFYTPLTTLTIARRASNSCGYKPPTGCRVLVPNVFCSTSASSTGWTGNQLHNSPSNRYEIQAASAGAIEVSDAHCNWYLNLTGAYSVDITNTVTSTGCLVVSNLATPFYFSGNACGAEAILNNNPYTFTNNPYGGEISYSRAIKAAATGSAVVSLDVSNSSFVEILYNQIEIFGDTGLNTRNSGNTYVIGCSNLDQFTCTGNTVINGVLRATSCSNGTITDTRYADILIGATSNTASTNVVRIENLSSNIVVDGITWFAGLTDVNCYNYIVLISTSSSNIKVRNIGTPSAPLYGGGTNKTQGAVTLSVVSNCELNRLYITSQRTNLIGASNTATNIIVDNCWDTSTGSSYNTCLNTTYRGVWAGAATTGQSSVYGSHWEDKYLSTTTGLLRIMCNEPTADSAAQAVITAGTPRYTSAGIVSMPTVGDQIVWEMWYYMLGHTAFANIAPTITGTLTGNFTYEFQWDTGSGYNGSWLTADAATLSGIGSWDPATGIKIKVRATVTVADPTNALTYIRFDTITDAVSQQILYPFQYTGAGTLPSFAAGTRIQIYNNTTAAEVYNDTPSGTSFIYQYYTGTGISSGDVLRIRMARAGYLPFESLSVASDTGFSVLGSQEVDDIYVANGVDGSLCDVSNGGEFEADYPNVQIDLDDPDNTTSIQRLYAWAKYTESTATGIETFFGAIDADNSLSYTIHDAIADIYLDNTKTDGLRMTGGWLYRDDGDIPVASTSTGPIYFESGIKLSASNANPFTNTSQNSRSYGQEWRDMYSTLLGKTTGGGTTTEIFYAPDGVTPRVTSVNDGVNRTSVTVSGS